MTSRRRARTRRRPPSPATAAAKGRSLERGMVVTSQHYATDVGAAVLRQGGNAIDAAVAVGYALAVVHPCCGNIGGGGFMMIHTVKGVNTFIDFRERAPLAATADMYLDANGKVDAKKSVDGYLSVGRRAPWPASNTPAVTTARWRAPACSRPSIRLARDGFVLEPQDVELLGEHTAQFQADPPAARMFLNGGRPYAVGRALFPARSRQDPGRDRLGRRGRLLSRAIARDIVAASKAHGGLLTMADFADYTVEERAPVACDYRGLTVLLPPPPSSGGVTICEMFGILSGLRQGATPAGNGERRPPAGPRPRGAPISTATRASAIRTSCPTPRPACWRRPISPSCARRSASTAPRRRPPRRGRRPAGEPPDHALFGGRSLGQRGLGDLHHQRRLRRQGGGRPHGRPAQRRDGRLHLETRLAQRLWPDPGQGQRHRARQAAAEFDGSRHRARQGGQVRWVLGAPAARGSSPPWRRCCWT